MAELYFYRLGRLDTGLIINSTTRRNSRVVRQLLQQGASPPWVHQAHQAHQEMILGLLVMLGAVREL